MKQNNCVLKVIHLFHLFYALQWFCNMFKPLNMDDILLL